MWRKFCRWWTNILRQSRAYLMQPKCNMMRNFVILRRNSWKTLNTCCPILKNGYKLLCCRGTMRTTIVRLWKFARGWGAKNPRCLPAICLININPMRCGTGGKLKLSKKTRHHCTGTRKLYSKSMATACMRV